MTRALFPFVIASLGLLSAEASWIVNPSPAMENAGIDIKVSAAEYLHVFYRMSDGTPHVTFGFKPPTSFNPLTEYPMQIWDVNLSNSVSRVKSMSMGIPPIKAHALTSSNLLVIGSSDQGYLSTYNPATGATNYLKICSDRDYYSCSIGTDNQVYFGTYSHARVESYNPADQSVKEWGQLDDALSLAAYTYSVAGDSNYIYGAIKENQGTLNWYLGILRKSDTNKTVLWKTGTSQDVAVRMGTNGFIYAGQATNGLTRWWRLTNEVPVLLGSAPTDLIPLWLSGNVNNDSETWSADEGWDIDASFDVSSASGSQSSATMGFKPTSQTNFTSVVETNGWVVSPGTIDLLQPWTADSLLWVVNAYGPLGNFVPGGTTSLLGPYKGLSAYDLLQSSATQVYIAGYHRATLRWNPLVPWTRVPLMSDYADTNVNPYTAMTGLGKYHYYLAQGNNGKIYIGSHWERDGTGGELGWYDPSNGTSGSERTTFLSYDVRDLKPVEGGTKMVYVSSAAKIFVWSVASFSQLTNFTVLAGATIDKVVEYQSGRLIGASGTNTVGFTVDGAQLWSNNIPVSAWGGTAAIGTVRHRLTLGPDNYVWLCAGGSLLRINPVDGSYVTTLATTNNYNVMFDEGDAYLYGTSTKVWKIANLLTQDREIRATTATIGSIVKAP